MPFFEVLSDGDDTNFYRTIFNEPTKNDVRNKFHSDTKYAGRRITKIKEIYERGEVCDTKVIPESE